MRPSLPQSDGGWTWAQVLLEGGNDVDAIDTSGMAASPLLLFSGTSMS